MPFPLSFTPEPSSPPLEYIIGIDESGRGPVLGPMIYTALYIPTTHQTQLKELGVDDSKQLTTLKREEIFTKVRENTWMGWETRALHAEEIGGKMLARDKVNLNAMSHDTAVELVQKILDKGINVTEVKYTAVWRTIGFTGIRSSTWIQWDHRKSIKLICKGNFQMSSA